MMYDWVDETAEPNGIAPVCRYCHRLIDSHPGDHTLSCQARGDRPHDSLSIKSWPWNCPRCESPSLASLTDHICDACWDHYVFCVDCAEDLYQ